MAKIGRAVGDRQFSSLDEANDFIRSFMEKENQGEASDLPLTPRDAAQELIYDAWEEPSRRRRIALAKKALKLWEDCADAYVILAEDEAKELEEEARLYAEGVKAGERALGPETFKKDKGHFWDVLETRPYMRARLGLAADLWDLGQRREGIGHLRDMLRLDPADHLGIRHLLINWLLLEGQDEEAGRLIRRFSGDPAAGWLYPVALWTFRKEGASPLAERRLNRAFRANPFVAAFLLGARKPPRNLADSYALGSEDEAAYYLIDGVLAWAQTPGAGDWLVETLMALMRKEMGDSGRSLDRRLRPEGPA